MSIPVRQETFVDCIEVGDWFVMEIEGDPPEEGAEDQTAVFVVRMGDVQFRIRAPYVEPGPIQVLEASRVKDEPRAKWPDLSNLRPQVIRLRRRRRDGPEGDDTDDPDPEPEDG